MTTDASAERARPTETISDADALQMMALDADYEWPSHVEQRLLRVAAALRAAEQPAPLELARKITRAVLDTLKKDGDNLAIFESVRDTLATCQPALEKGEEGWRNHAWPLDNALRDIGRTAQPSHPADAGSGEDAAWPYSGLIATLRNPPLSGQYGMRMRAGEVIENLVSRITRLSSELSAAREQIAELQSVVAYNKRMADDREALLKDCNRTLEHIEAERDALSQEVGRAYEECAKIAEGFTSYDDGIHKSIGAETTGERIATAIRAASLARGE